MTEGSRTLTLDEYWHLRLVSDARISPDGSSVAYVVAWPDEARNEICSAIWLADLASGRAKQITNGEAQDTSPRWAPDGSRLAFVSTRRDKKQQVYVMEAGGGEARRLTTAEHGAHTPVWSPDGTQICFSSTLPSDRQKVGRETAWFQNHPDADASRSLRRQTGLWSRMDMRGWYENRTHLFVVSIDEEGAEPRQLTHGDWDASEPAWSPDGDLIAFVTNDVANREFTMLAMDLRTVRVADGEMQTLTDGSLTAGTPSWSPDGQTIAFYGNLHASPGYENRHVWTVSRVGGDVRDRVADLDRPCGSGFQGDHAANAPSRPAWSEDGKRLYFTVLDGGTNALHELTLDNGGLRRVSTSEGDIQSVELVPGEDRASCVAASPTHPYDVASVPLSGGEVRFLVDTNASLFDGKKMIAPEHVTFTGPGDVPIDGWLYAPTGERPYPLILNVHGGPNGSWGRTFYFQAQALASQGYGSLYLNPRGSGGYGKAFADMADWGLDDFQDLIAGVDLVIERGEADPHRLGVTGISYGGFMTNWTVSHTDRFAAGVSVNGVSNFVTMFGISDITAVWFQQKYGDSFGGPFWGDEASWARYRERSPLSHVENVHTPLLLIQAENDYRCPIDQGEQMLTALRVLNRPVELIRFPGCSHSIANTGTPVQRYLQWAVAFDWFDQYVKGTGTRVTEQEAVPAD